MRRNKRNKKATGAWFGVLCFALIGAACGALFLLYLDRAEQAGLSRGQRLWAFALMMVCLYGAFLIQIIIHEAGHLVFGLLTGYRFCSFRVFSLMWIKEKGKIRLKRMSLAGTGGQCLMGPPDLADGKMPVMLYNFGGAILNLVSAALCLALSFLCPPVSMIRVFLWFLAVIGLGLALMNGLPLPAAGLSNDGRNALDLSRGGEAARAFWIQMKVNELTSDGIRLRDMPEEWFAVPSADAMNNGIIAPLGVLACSRLMDQHRFAEADALMKDLLAQKNAVAAVHRGLMVCDRMFLELTGENRPAVLSAFRTKAQEQLMKAMKTFPSVLRTEYACALLGGRDPARAEGFRQQFEKAVRSYPYPGEIQAERELMALADAAASGKEEAQQWLSGSAIRSGGSVSMG